MRDQLFCLVLGVPVRNRKLQQELKDLVILKAVQALLKIAVSQAFPMSFHLLFLFRIRHRNASICFLFLFVLFHTAHLRVCSSATHPCWRRH